MISVTFIEIWYVLNSKTGWSCCCEQWCRKVDCLPKEENENGRKNRRMWRSDDYFPIDNFWGWDHRYMSTDSRNSTGWNVTTPVVVKWLFLPQVIFFQQDCKINKYVQFQCYWCRTSLSRCICETTICAVFRASPAWEHASCRKVRITSHF